jgi:hypothetical protein
MWVAARAQFRIDPSALEQWTFALEHRAEPLVMMVEAREQFALAVLAYDEARGPAFRSRAREVGRGAAVSNVRSDIDLDALARPTPELKRPKRSWLRVAIPLAILLAFLAILVSSLGDIWRGSVEVTVVRPKVVDASSTASAGTPLFQAAGWIEPDPFAIEVSALAPGVGQRSARAAVRFRRERRRGRADDPQDAQLALDAATAAFAQSQGALANRRSRIRQRRRDLRRRARAQGERRDGRGRRCGTRGGEREPIASRGARRSAGQGGRERARAATRTARGRRGR